MAARVKMVPGSHYEDQDGKKYGPGESFETDEHEAKALIEGGSAVRVDEQGRSDQ
jgi:hypothetical protein